MIIWLSQAGREGLTLRLTHTRGRKIALGRDGFFGRRNVSRLRSSPKWFSARDERTGARTARDCRTPSKGARCPRRPPSASSSSPNRSGRALLCVCVLVCVQTRALIACMFTLLVNRRNQRAIRPERRGSQLAATSFTARDGHVHHRDPAAALASMSPAPRWGPR